jgi:hypothetical protein
MRNCRSKKREFTLFNSMVNVPPAVSRVVTAYPVMLEMVKVASSVVLYKTANYQDNRIKLYLRQYGRAKQCSIA